MVLFFSILTFSYCLLTFLLFRNWMLLGKEQENGVLPQLIFENCKVSVIIPVRNEAENILSLLEDLNRQSYCPELMQVIVVDDSSIDQTYNIVKSFVPKAHYSLQLLQLQVPQNFKGGHKKKAIELGVNAATGSIIVTTDGDCRVGEDWLASLVHPFLYRNAVMVCGPVGFHEEQTCFEHLQTIEFGSLVASGAACLRMKFPNMCNGANFAFYKEIFQEVQGYQGNEHIASGDDEFLMHKVYALYKQRVVFVKSFKAIVFTKAKKNLQEFYSQRIRWGSKWKFHKSFRVKLLAMFIFLYHFCLLAVGLATLAGYYPCEIFFMQIIAKLWVEFVFLSSVLSFFGKKMAVLRFLLLETIYSFYIVASGLAANIGKVEWKGRRI